MATASMIQLPVPRPVREIWTVKHVAQYLIISDRTVTTMATRKEIPGFRIGNLWRFYRDEIEAMNTDVR